MVLNAAKRRDAGRSRQHAGVLLQTVRDRNGWAVADKAVQFHGGAGYMEEYAAARFYRGRPFVSDLRRHEPDSTKYHRPKPAQRVRRLTLNTAETTINENG